jgi:hypothetical protein
MSVDVFYLIRRELDERVEDLTTAIVSGSAKSIEEYRGLTSALSEVVRIKELVKDVEKRFIEED